MPLKIVFANNKGGVGKTTSAINVAGFLALKGFRVLTIDLDPSANLTIGFGFQKSDMCGRLLLGEVDVEKAILKYSDNISVLPSSLELDSRIKDIEKNIPRTFEMLKMRLTGRIESSFDFVIIDTQPYAKSTASLNGMAYADYVIIPTEAAHYSIAGIAEMNRSIAQIRSDMLNPNLQLMGMLITFFENTRDCIKNENILRNTFNGTVFRSKIRKNTALAAAASEGRPISNKNSTGYWDYRDFTDEILKEVL